MEIYCASTWEITHSLSIAMDILGLLGLAGLYARQVNKVGWLALAGYLLFSLLWALSLTFHIIEAFIEPLLATEAPKFVAGLLLAFGIVLPFLTHSLVQHPFDRIFAVPVGVALAWLGYALWSERREQAS